MTWPSLGDGTPAANLSGRARGTATPAAPGGTASFTIAHGLGSTPTAYGVVAGNALSAPAFFITADATNLTVTYLVAPSAGALRLVWSAEL